MLYREILPIEGEDRSIATGGTSNENLEIYGKTFITVLYVTLLNIQTEFHNRLDAIENDIKKFKRKKFLGITQAVLSIPIAGLFAYLSIKSGIDIHTIKGLLIAAGEALTVGGICLGNGLIIKNMANRLITDSEAKHAEKVDLLEEYTHDFEQLNNAGEEFRIQFETESGKRFGDKLPCSYAWNPDKVTELKVTEKYVGPEEYINCFVPAKKLIK